MDHTRRSGLASMRFARPLSSSVTGSQMATRVVPSVPSERYDTARASAKNVKPADKVAGGKYLSSNIDPAAAGCNIQTANLSCVASSKDPTMPQTLYVFGLVATTLKCGEQMVAMDYTSVLKTKEQATDIYNQYLDTLKVQGPDVQRYPVEMEPVQQSSGSGKGVAGHQWVMKVEAPIGRLRLVFTNGQSQAMATFPVYDTRQGKVGLGALGLRIGESVREVRERHRVRVVTDVLRLDRRNIPLPDRPTSEQQLQAAWRSIAVDAHLLSSDPEQHPTDGVVCGALEYYSLPASRYGAGFACPVYPAAKTLIEECGIIILEGRYAKISICLEDARDDLLRCSLRSTAVDNLGGQKELSDPTTLTSMGAVMCEQLQVARDQILRKAGRSAAPQPPAAAAQQEAEGAAAQQVPLMEARFCLPGGLVVGPNSELMSRVLLTNQGVSIVEYSAETVQELVRSKLYLYLACPDAVHLAAVVWAAGLRSAEVSEYCTFGWTLGGDGAALDKDSVPKVVKKLRPAAYAASTFTEWLADVYSTPAAAVLEVHTAPPAVDEEAELDRLLAGGDSPDKAETDEPAAPIEDVDLRNMRDQQGAFRMGGRSGGYIGRGGGYTGGGGTRGQGRWNGGGRHGQRGGAAPRGRHGYGGGRHGGGLPAAAADRPAPYGPTGLTPQAKKNKSAEIEAMAKALSFSEEAQRPADGGSQGEGQGGCGMDTE